MATVDAVCAGVQAGAATTARLIILTASCADHARVYTGGGRLVVERTKEAICLRYQFRKPTSTPLIPPGVAPGLLADVSRDEVSVELPIYTTSAGLQERDKTADRTHILAQILERIVPEFGQMMIRSNELERKVESLQGKVEALQRRATTLSQDLESSQAAAKTAENSKNQFLANMSHEIRTPLHAIGGMAGLLKDTTLDADQKHYAQVILESAAHLNELISDILDLAKIDSGHLPIHPRPVHVRHLVESAVDLVAARAEQKGLPLRVLVAEDVPEVIDADPGRVRQVLVNLLTNAVKFTNTGEINVRVSRRAGHAGCTLAFAVQDTGIGVPRNGIEKLFQPFEQLDASRSRDHGGTGLGLAIARTLVEGMGGRIHVESTESVGSTFLFTLPTRETTIPGGEGTLAGRRIVAPDVPEIRKAIRSLGAEPVPLALIESAAGFVVDARENDAVALLDDIKIRRPHLPGVVITDAPGAVRGQRIQPLATDRLDDLPATLTTLLRRPEAAAVDKDMAERHPLDILIVEDNRLNMVVAQAALERLGYHADEASDGVEAVEMTQEHNYDLIFMDLQMPRLDGIAATRRIRASATVQPRIVALTAHVTDADREACLDAGMDDYLTKPFTVNDLAVALQATHAAAPPS